MNGYIITNKHIPGTVSVSGQKIWDDGDDRDGIRPASVTVKLLKNGAEADSLKTSADYGWKYTFANLPKAESGMVIRYSVTEDPVPEGYEAAVDGYDITNKHVPEEKELFTITFDPNGGILDGGTNPVSTKHQAGETIAIREAPDREGWTFLYWKGSEYRPGESYTVDGDHTFTAQWTKPEPEPSGNPEPSATPEPTATPGPTNTPGPTATPGPSNKPEPSDKPDPPGPGLDYKFTFTKKWSGGHEDSIDWTLYDQDGKVVHKKFNKKVISDTEWRYEAWFASDRGYYIVENVPGGYKARYENTGIHANENDRCYNGGTIINYRIPKTGDRTVSPVWWIGCVAIGLLGTAGIVLYRKRGKRR